MEIKISNPLGKTKENSIATETIMTVSGNSEKIDNNRVLNSSFEYSTLTFKEMNIEYAEVLSWLLETASNQDTLPFIKECKECENIESSISRVLNVLRGKGFNGTIAIETDAEVNTTPARAHVEVSLL